MRGAYAVALLFVVLPMVAAHEDDEYRAEILKLGSEFLEYGYMPSASSASLVTPKKRMFDYSNNVKYLPMPAARSDKKVTKSNKETAKSFSAEMGGSVPYKIFLFTAKASTDMVWKSKVNTFRLDDTITIQKGHVVFNGVESADFMLPDVKTWLWSAPVEKIVSKFGMLIPQKITFGAIFRATVVKEVKEDESSKKFAIEAGAEVIKKVSSAGFSFGSSRASEDKTGSTSLHVMAHATGGLPSVFMEGLAMDEARKKWASTLRGRMAGIKYKMIPIWEVVRSLGIFYWSKADQLKAYIIRTQHIAGHPSLYMNNSPCPCRKTESSCKDRASCRWDLSPKRPHKKGETWDSCRKGIKVDAANGWVTVNVGEEKTLDMSGRPRSFLWECHQSGRRRWSRRRRRETSNCGGGNILKVGGQRRRFKFECFQAVGGACDLREQPWSLNWAQEPRSGCPTSSTRLMEEEPPQAIHNVTQENSLFGKTDNVDATLPLPLLGLIGLATVVAAASLGLATRIRKRRYSNYTCMRHTCQSNHEIEDCTDFETKDEGVLTAEPVAVAPNQGVVISKASARLLGSL